MPCRKRAWISVFCCIRTILRGKCMAGLNDKTDGRQSFSDQEPGDEYEPLRFEA